MHPALKNRLEQMTPIEIYEEVLSKKLISTFPKGFWTADDSKEKAKMLVRYLIIDKMKIPIDENLPEILTPKLLKLSGLSGVFIYAYNQSLYDLINDCFPEISFPKWKFIMKGEWTPELGIQATTWLIEDVLVYSHAKICNKLTQLNFMENGLAKMLKHLYDNNIYNAINAAYPGQYKIWELKKCKCKWTYELATEAIKWVVEEKLKFTEEDMKEKFSRKILVSFGLRPMLQELFDDSAIKAIRYVYGDTMNCDEFFMVKSASNKFHLNL